MLLDGVTAYLPSPLDVTNRALDVNKNQAPLELPSSQQVGLWPLIHKNFTKVTSWFQCFLYKFEFLL